MSSPAANHLEQARDRLLSRVAGFDARLLPATASERDVAAFHQEFARVAEAFKDLASAVVGEAGSSVGGVSLDDPADLLSDALGDAVFGPLVEAAEQAHLNERQADEALLAEYA